MFQGTECRCLWLCAFAVIDVYWKTVLSDVKRTTEQIQGI